MSNRWSIVLSNTVDGILWNNHVISNTKDVLVQVMDWGTTLMHTEWIQKWFLCASNAVSFINAWVVYQKVQQRSNVAVMGIMILVVCIVATLVYLSIYQQQQRRRRRRKYSDVSTASVSSSLRRRSNSYGNLYDYEATHRNRNRSNSNESYMKQQQQQQQQSPRIRSWSNTFLHSCSKHRASLLSQKSPPPSSRRRFSSISRPHRSADILRDSDEQRNDYIIDDVVFWQTLEQEEEETRLQKIRDRTNSKQSTGSKGNNTTTKVWSSSPSSQSALRLVGPSVTVIEYSTITPPPTWSKANRKLIVSDKAWDLSRMISLQLLNTNNAHSVGTATLLIEKTKVRSMQQQNQNHQKGVLKGSVIDYSVHVHSPPESGVLDIYMKGCEQNEWMEHTFTSASAAAQFQLDLLALQIVGPSIQNVYSAFRIVHQGSDVYMGDEPVLHDSTRVFDSDDGADGEPSATYTAESGIAWDDVMRCLGSSFPSIRLRLEAMRWLEVYSSLDNAPSTSERKNGAATAMPGDDVGKDVPLTPINTDAKFNEQRVYADLNSTYRHRRRLLLGPVDFFRLFIPKLPETAVPEADCSRTRMEQMLRLRKRVASAAVLVRSYTRAKMVVNIGWEVAPHLPLPEAYWKRRYAFDDDIDNHQYDSTSSNVYYEGSVSRDIDCQVRGLHFWKTPSRSKRTAAAEIPIATSLYQAYSLVGIHSFEWSSDDDICPLHYKKDPVQSIPSLHRLIASHPDLDFFVCSIFLPSQETVIVHVYVRSLPRGIDPKFDHTMTRFIEGNEEVRKKKLEVMLQLEIDKNGLSFIERCVLWWLLLLLRLTVGRRYTAPNVTAMNDRTSLPPLVLSNCGETVHFGGSLRSDEAMPSNYVATTAHLVPSRDCNLITRMMLSYIELGGLARNVADVTFILAGDDENELPERALCTSRTVRATLTMLPKAFVSPTESDISKVVATNVTSKSDKGIASLILKLFVIDPAVAATEIIIRSVVELNRSAPTGPVCLTKTMESRFGSKKASVDRSATEPFEKAINEIIFILEGIRVPMRPMANVTIEDIATDDVAGLANIEFEKVPILNTINRIDIARYLTASKCNPKDALARIVESAIWRGTTFPVDTRTCRIELQAGQFFHQGFDLNGNPVFYFRNMCLGPWRKDEDAVIAAVIHRLESTLERFVPNNPLVQCTLIVLAGKPHCRQRNGEVVLSNKKNSDDGKTDQSTIASTAMSTITGNLEDNETSIDNTNEDVGQENDGIANNDNSAQSSNPRMFSGEHWNVHTCRSFIERLVNVLMTHYPERLAKALVVVGHGNKMYAHTAMGGVLFLTGIVPSATTRDKVRFLTRYRDLQSHVHRTQLVTLVGGTQVVNAVHYECI